MQIEDIKIKYAIIHILDSSNIMPVLSDTVLDLTNEPIREYLKKHIFKCFTSENNKLCSFEGNENEFALVVNSAIDEMSFVLSSKTLSKNLFSLMRKYFEIPSADIIFSLFEAEHTTYFAVLKMNYKTSFIHHVATVNEDTIASILLQKVALPTENQRVDESIIINSSDYAILLQEKKINIDTEKRFYLSELFLQCSSAISAKDKLNTVTKIVEEINKKYYDSDIEKKVEFKKALIEEYEQKGEIEPISVIDKVYQNNIEIKNEFVTQIEKQGLKDERIAPTEKIIAKKTERQIFKTDTGIELNIPVDVYDNNRLLEFITNPDGTISIIIKNISNLISK